MADVDVYKKNLAPLGGIMACLNAHDEIIGRGAGLPSAATQKKADLTPVEVDPNARKKEARRRSEGKA